MTATLSVDRECHAWCAPQQDLNPRKYYDMDRVLSFYCVVPIVKKKKHKKKSSSAYSEATAEKSTPKTVFFFHLLLKYFCVE